jgi:type IV pilus assembly protein PilP
MSMIRIWVALAIAAVLGGCSEEQHELRSWMDEQRRKAAPVTEKIEPPKKFSSFRYVREGEQDPFSPGKIALQVAASPSSGLRPDLARRREVLEGFPLESISMVGHMSDRKSNFALLKADGMVYQARVGNHAGQNYGVITRVSETEIRLRELVQDAAGDWVARETALKLQETMK